MTVEVRRSAKPGDIIAFGSYPQTMGGEEGTEVLWRVLRNSGSELFVMSKYILDCKRYHGEFSETTWRDCDLRKWLNHDFYYTAFNASERGLIRTALCADNGEGSPDAEDNVFLLSVAEVKSLTTAHSKNIAKPERRTIGTQLAKQKKTDGCHLYVYDKSNPNDYIVDNRNKYGCSWWWLRTQVRSKLGRSPRTSFVGPNGSIRGYCRVNLINYGVRPALKLSL